MPEDLLVVANPALPFASADMKWLDGNWSMEFSKRVVQRVPEGHWTRSSTSLSSYLQDSFCVLAG
jgi:hypothetical protein